MMYRWKNGDGEWVFIPIHLIKNSYLLRIRKKYKRQAELAQDSLIEALNKDSTKGIHQALKTLHGLDLKLTAINEEFFQREVLGIHNFKYRGRYPQSDESNIPDAA